MIYIKVETEVNITKEALTNSSHRRVPVSIWLKRMDSDLRRNDQT